MYLRDSLYVLARRWYVVLPVLLLLAFAVNLLARATPYSYKTEASVVLLSPSVKVTTDPGATNPYLGFSGNLNATAVVITRVLTDDPAVQALAKQGATAAYTVGPDPTSSSAPILVMTTTATSEALSARTMNALLTLVNTELVAIQTKQGAPKQYLITSQVTSHKPTQRINKAKIKVLAAGGAVALVLPTLAAFAVEGWSFRRRARRDAIDRWDSPRNREARDAYDASPPRGTAPESEPEPAARRQPTARAEPPAGRERRPPGRGRPVPDEDTFVYTESVTELIDRFPLGQEPPPSRPR